MRTLTALMLPWLLLVGSCSAPPKPPTVDETRKRPANTAMAVELQACRNDLQNSRILTREWVRLAESAAAISTHQQLPAPAQAPPAANSVFTVRFEFASAQVAIPAEVASTLVEEARTAPLVLLRGRTDGALELPAESRIARDRALAVRDQLVAAGIDPSRIRVTYQPIGDHAADNATATGRAYNRRVEIEVYRALPVAGASPSPH